MRSVFVAGAANHFLRTWERYRVKASLWHLELVYGKGIFVAKRTGRLRDGNLDVKILRQSQRFVNLEVQISRQLCEP